VLRFLVNYHIFFECVFTDVGWSK